jgi:prephenate dehydratase
MVTNAPAERAGGRPRVGYLGPEGTFTEEALLASAQPSAVEPVPFASIYETVLALRDGRVRWAIVPIENSLDGSVTITLDLLADEARDVRIVGEVQLAVRHALIAAAQVPLREMRTLLTHPQVPGQCARFLRGELAHARVLAAPSTAQAVRTVVEDGDRTQVALGTALAAEIYGATVVREDVQDREDNETRFVWLARESDAGEPPPLSGERGEWKTSLVFWGSGAGSPGWLVRCLSEFADRDINLTKIESRPRRERMGSYMFFADLVGHAEREPVVSAIAGVRGLCDEVRVLGTYPGAPAAA